MTINVYGVWHSSATNRVLTVLPEKEVEFKLIRVNSYAGENKKSEHLALHPFARIPVLQDEDVHFVVESQELQPIWRPLVNQLLGPTVQNSGKVPDQKIVAENTERLGKVLDVYEACLSDNKYLAGDVVSIADLSHLPLGHLYFNLAKERDLLKARRHVATWWADISNRPAWRKVLENAATFFQKWAK